ncbi:MAG: zinc-ribbon domain-containing protein [Octadecabacter sp.]
MRLICPNCGAQYEVADDVIPNAGRDVQCSNCGHTWFEHPGASEAAEEGIELPPPPAAPPQRDVEEEHDPVADPEPEEEPQSADAAPLHEEPAPQETHTETQAPHPERRTIDPDVAGILREEADREEAARAAEARPDLETQPDLGIDDAPSAQDQRDDESRRRMARLRGRSGAIAASSAAASRRELLPDIEEINSTLRSSTEREGSGHQTEAVAVSGRQRKRGFRFGFWLIVLIAAALTAVYVFEPQISAAVPQIKEQLASFVVMVDNARLWLDLKMQDILTWIESTSEG